MGVGKVYVHCPGLPWVVLGFLPWRRVVIADIQPLIQIRDADVSYATVIADFESDPTLYQQLAAANALLVPMRGHHDYEHPVFPSHTHDLISFLRTNQTQEISFEIASSNEGYRELALQSADWFLPVVVLADATVSQLVIEILSQFLYDRLRGLVSSLNRSRVKSTIVLQIDGKSLSITYDGPIEGYAELMKRAVSTLGVARKR